MNNLMITLRHLSLPVTAIIILIAYLVISQECKREEKYPPDGYILVQESFIDSLQAIANISSDTIPSDTVFVKGDIIYIPGKDVPIPAPVDPQTNFYTDSIVNDLISVWVEITTQGIITDWDWKYQPIIHEIETIIKKPVPYPVPFEVIVRKSGLYGSLGVGGNQSAFILSGSIDYINRKDNLYGVQYLRFGQQDFYLFKIGTKLFKK